MGSFKAISCWSFPRPGEEDDFERHYWEVHVPLAAAIPGTVSLTLTLTSEGLEDAPPSYYRVAETEFESPEALAAAMGTPAVGGAPRRRRGDARALRRHPRQRARQPGRGRADRRAPELSVGFVKTPEEIARIEAAVGATRASAAPRCSRSSSSSTPEFVAGVLPPPLEPVAEPRMRAMVGRWGSNCVGDFAGGCVYVACTHEGLEGEYNVSQYMDGDAATIFGRDVFGEPKKMARATLRARGARCTGRSSATASR